MFDSPRGYFLISTRRQVAVFRGKIVDFVFAVLPGSAPLLSIGSDTGTNSAALSTQYDTRFAIEAVVPIQNKVGQLLMAPEPAQSADCDHHHSAQIVILSLQIC